MPSESCLLLCQVQLFLEVLEAELASDYHPSADFRLFIVSLNSTRINQRLS